MNVVIGIANTLWLGGPDNGKDKIKPGSGGIPP